jgi:COMPASS component SWD3
MRTLADDERAPATGVCLSKNNKYILTAGNAYRNLRYATINVQGLDGTVKMWEFKTGMIVKTFKGHPNQKYSTSFGFIKLGLKTGFEINVDCRVYVGGEDGNVYIYDLESRVLMEKIKVCDKAVIAINVGGELMATGGLEGGDVKVWNVGSDIQQSDARSDALDDQQSQSDLNSKVA